MRKLRERPLQIYLRPDQDAALRMMAKQENVALAELVRRSVDQLLLQSLVDNDPTLQLIGIGHAKETDLAENHDYYIAQAILAESAPPVSSKPVKRRAIAPKPKSLRRKRVRTKGSPA